MPVWGRIWPCPFLKNVKMKKKKKKERKKKETKNSNSIDTIFDRNFHFVSGTEGEIYTWFVLTRLCLAGGVLVAASKEAFRRRQENPSERIKPCRQGCLAQCVQHWFHLGTSSFFSNVFGGTSSSCDCNVQQTTSGRFQRRARCNCFEKNLSARVLQSLPGVKLWLASSQI